MKNINKDLLSMNPVKHYKAPQVPTLEDSHDNPVLLKKLPSRWQKSASVIACIGLVGAMTLSTGCLNLFTRNFHGCSEFHHGGSGAMPMYVVYLTEQEALGLIRTQLETAGLNFNATPPDYTANVWWNQDQLSLKLFDEEKSVAIAYIDSDFVSVNNAQYSFSVPGSELAEQAIESFAQQTNDISVGVFYNPGVRHNWSWDENNPNYEELKAELKEHLSAQVQEFIDLLQAEGIL